MTKWFTFQLFSRSTYQKKTNEKQEAGLLKAPGDKVRFIKDFARAYEAVDLTSCEHKDLILN